MKKRDLFKKGVRIILSIALLLGISSPFISLNISDVPSYFGLAFPFLILIAVLLGLFSIRTLWKNKAFFIVLIISLFFIPRFIGFHNHTESLDGIKVLSFNIRGGYSIFGKDKSQEQEDLKKLKELLSSDIDILFLQEMNQRVSNWTDDFFKYEHVVTSKRSGTLIASDYAIIDSGEIDFGTKVNSCVWADISTPKGIIRAYNVHFQSSKIYEDTEKAIQEGREYNPDVFTSLKGILNKYRRQGLKRIKQAKEVKEHIANSQHDVLLAGDFNESPMSYTYQLMREHLGDHFSCINGFGATYPQSSPLVRIDYIMSSKNIECEQFEILRNISLSDHLPILSTIDIKNTDNE